jgi:hypothetical protein
MGRDKKKEKSLGTIFNRPARISRLLRSITPTLGYRKALLITICFCFSIFPCLQRAFEAIFRYQPPEALSRYTMAYTCFVDV